MKRILKRNTKRYQARKWKKAKIGKRLELEESKVLQKRKNMSKRDKRSRKCLKIKSKKNRKRAVKE